MVTELKRLPLDDAGNMLRNFTACGNKYEIRSAEEGISITRFNEYQRISGQLGFGVTFQDMYDNLTKALNLTDAIGKEQEKMWSLVLHLEGMRKAILNYSEDRNVMALYMCSLFIVRKDEDLTTWSISLARQKIEDWNKEGYDMRDFLALAHGSVTGFNNVYSDLIVRYAKELEHLTLAFSGDGSFPQMEKEPTTQES